MLDYRSVSQQVNLPLLQHKILSTSLSKWRPQKSYHSPCLEDIQGHSSKTRLSRNIFLSTSYGQKQKSLWKRKSWKLPNKNPWKSSKTIMKNNNHGSPKLPCLADSWRILKLSHPTEVKDHPIVEVRNSLDITGYKKPIWHPVRQAPYI